MRKALFFVAVLLFMAAPAMAASNVDITCTRTVVGDVNWITVSYTGTGDPCRIRAFGLDITLTPADGNVKDVCSLNTNYRIYPGQIAINENGEVTDYSRPYAAADINDANIAVEMGSLYTRDSNYSSDPNAGYNMIPATSGDLFKFSFINACEYKVDVNVLRGGIVMEDPNVTPTTNLPIDVNVCGGGCGTCPLDITGGEYVPDGYVGPEDLYYVLNLISGCDYYYCDVTGLPAAEACLDVTGGEYVPDGYVGPEDLYYVLNLISGCDYYYCTCP